MSRSTALSMSRRLLAATAAATALTIGLALPALAHVTINPNSVEQGGFAKVAFRVPNERDDASTTKLEVELPTDHPLAFVSVRPVSGWKVKVTESKLDEPVAMEDGELTEAVTKITWSGGEVQPGQFQEFEVSMGRMPEDVDQLVFPATQTYSSGEVVKWADRPAAGGAEAEHPAPVLKLVPPAAEGSAATPAPASTGAVAVPVAAGPAGSGTDTAARFLGVAGIVAGLIGTVIGVLGLRRSRA